MKRRKLDSIIPEAADVDFKYSWIKDMSGMLIKQLCQ